ncbi:MAG TPA: Hpt domain-containing protein [Bacteroidia bacterium]|jgi:HPt (histidine-containing phosphotransfer) domain-containing protein|nr:Hpt domain-containing protein [Bacteroidia bacterium]
MTDKSTLSYLYALADGDKRFVTEILDLMIKNIPIDIVSIDKAISDNDLQQMRRNAHHMKSSIQYSNDLELSELLAVIENKKDSSSAVAEAGVLLPQLKELSNKLLEVLLTEKKKIG